MSYQTFNGWNIVPMPSFPGPRSIDFTINDTVGETVSPFTRQSQQQYWPGGDWWALNISLPPIKSLQYANQWIAWLMALRGKFNVFQIGDPLGRFTLGSASGTPVIDANAGVTMLASATRIATRGWTPSTQSVLLPGDYLQIGYRLHKVAQPAAVAADSSGKAAFDIWPSLREQPLDGTTIITSGTTGLFRLAENKREWSVNEARIYGISFKAIEAR